ncbi:chorismate mutase [Ramaria rubella]|nr:chorismate mutase [Ramaria rubella]
MRFAARLVAAVSLTAAAVAVSVTSDSTDNTAARPFFEVPTLLEIRDILSQLEAPIVSTIVQRSALPVNPSLYTGGTRSTLQSFIASREASANALGRYAYGTLEYPFTLPLVAPDVATKTVTFPPGRFHQDSFSGNSNITAFYTGTFIPLLNATTTSFFFSLTNASTGANPGKTHDDAALSLDTLLLQLLSNRAHIGKIVAESKFVGSPAQYTPLIQAQNANSIRTLLTNTTQETQVLDQADTAAVALSTAWVTAGALVPDNFEAGVRNAAAKVFRELIDITTEIEIEYLLERL